MDISAQVLIRQILQQFLAIRLHWPADHVLRKAAVQQSIYSQCFDSPTQRALGPSRYRYQVLKALVKRLESAIIDPEQDEISDNLANALSELMVEGFPSELDAARQKSWVTFAFPSDPSRCQRRDKSISLLESRHVFSGSGTTGLRTWEAALHLGTYLLDASNYTEWIKGKTILELGAGPGFLSILCASALGAKQVFATDGSDEVIEALKSNSTFNETEDVIVPGVLRWGWALQTSVLEQVVREGTVDTVIGADVTFDRDAIPALISSIRHAFEVWPKADILISATVRNPETFAVFERGCVKNKFIVSEIDFAMVPFERQQFFFYDTSAPIRILHIRAPDGASDAFRPD